MFFGTKKTYLLDYDTLSDPRIAEFIELGLLNGRLLVPEPSTTVATDHRARRAQESLERLRKVRGIAVKPDRKLLDRNALLAALRRSKGLLITTNPSLAAACETGSVVRTTDIYRLFKPSYLPGTELRIKIAKKGKDKDEGIGYLDGGIKVVVDGAAGLVGTEIDVVIQGALSTDVGRVVFAKQKYTEVR